MKTKIILSFLFLICQCAYCQWELVNNFYSAYDLITLHNNLFVIGKISSINDGIFLYKSTDNGSTWIKSYPTSLVSGNLNGSGVITDGTNLFVFTKSGVGSVDTLFVSSNDGTSWYKRVSFIGIPQNSGLSQLLYGEAGSLFASFSSNSSGNSYDIYKSTDLGNSWVLKYHDIYNHISMHKIDNLAIINQPLGSIISLNSGETWQSISNYFLSLAKIGSVYFAGDGNSSNNYSIYKSTNNGSNWSSILNTDYKGGFNLLYIGNTLISTTYDGTSGGTILTSTNNGANWVDKSLGYNTNSFIENLTFNSTYFFLTNNSYKIYRRQYSQLVNLNNLNSKIFTEFSMSQNYPNPFNPITNIKFKIPKIEYVTIKIFDVVGKKVKELVNQNMIPGEYIVDFDGSSLESGVYFYRIETGDYVETRKMILVK